MNKASSHGPQSSYASYSGSTAFGRGQQRSFGPGLRNRDLFSRLIAAVDCSPWGASTGRSAASRKAMALPLYTPEERQRRDGTLWTMVQGVLAPLQFAVFLISLACVLRYLVTGTGLNVANASIVVKTVALYTIMVTGSIWERKVFGRYLFARSFFWEDVFSMLVLALHTAYLAALATGWLSPQDLMLLALTAYASYAVNAAQFVFKMRAGRRETAWLPAAGV